MSDQPDNLVLHQLRELRAHMDARFDKLTTAHTNLTAEVRLSNAHISALVQGELHTLGRVGELEARIARIERRLELNDPAIPEGQ